MDDPPLLCPNGELFVAAKEKPPEGLLSEAIFPVSSLVGLSSIRTSLSSCLGGVEGRSGVLVPKVKGVLALIGSLAPAFEVAAPNVNPVLALEGALKAEKESLFSGTAGGVEGGAPKANGLLLASVLSEGSGLVAVPGMSEKPPVSDPKRGLGALALVDEEGLLASAVAGGVPNEKEGLGVSAL